MRGGNKGRERDRERGSHSLLHLCQVAHSEVAA